MTDRPPPTPAPSDGDRSWAMPVGAGAVFGIVLGLGAPIVLLGILAFGALAELRAAREALELSKANEALCHDALIDAKARKEQIDEWLKTAATRGRLGGVGGTP